jgi:hypothetical protein
VEPAQVAGEGQIVVASPADAEGRLNQTLLGAAGLLGVDVFVVAGGEGTRIASVLAGDSSGASDALRAAVHVQEGRWAEAQTAFEAAFKKRQAETIIEVQKKLSEILGIPLPPQSNGSEP